MDGKMDWDVLSSFFVSVSPIDFRCFVLIKYSELSPGGGGGIKEGSSTNLMPTANIVSGSQAFDAVVAPTRHELELQQRLAILEMERQNVVQAQQVVNVPDLALSGSGGGTAGNTVTVEDAMVAAMKNSKDPTRGDNDTECDDACNDACDDMLGCGNPADGRRKKRICGLPRCIACFVVTMIAFVAIAVGVMAVVMGGKGDGVDGIEGGFNNSPDFVRFTEFQNILSQVTPNSLMMSDTTSPQFQALEFLANDDELYLEPTLTTELVERFVMAVHYYSTTGRDDNKDETNWHDDTNWLSGESICSWRGVTCDDVDGEERVVQLALRK